jgi:aspartate ammonia-lyase
MRIESDFLGSIEIPESCLYGIHTFRALHAFPVHGPRIRDVAEFVRAFACTKLASAKANLVAEALTSDIGEAIAGSCRDLLAGEPRMRDALLLPVLQGGAGTSTNMNFNEVIANRALERLDRDHGDYAVCHPNDHVNRSQSTNDVYPTALRLALNLRQQNVKRSITYLVRELQDVALRHSDSRKLGRTQLRDAVPMTVGEEFTAWADAFAAALIGLDDAADSLLTVNLGGTAIGTSLGAPQRYLACVVDELAEASGLEVRTTPSRLSATTDAVSLLTYSAGLRSASIVLSKLCNDLRLLSSGPRTGLEELRLPAVQAGSSMMPGKVNPVVPEYANQASFRIRGLDSSVALALDAGQLQLNAMLPVVAVSLFEAQTLLADSCDALARLCIHGIVVNEARLRTYADSGLGELSILAASLGYEASSALASRAIAAGLVPRQLLNETGKEPAK